ncbi:3-deoxy-D-manno-octulosonic acid transferase [Sideroxyarcus emersonii]|uniref:3-deoxy-D-manno-octulosonic acid transferase n=2 Tax=Sideroxyarcus emersonii TaxID=2764705 RepID=A0AAN2C029_9PROT|nr:3-deoxy-D-manno-octulosonic acid transferase [Sideroxyarcus emersonii]
MRLFDSRPVYTALLWLLLPYAFFHLWWRSRRQPEYLDHIGERFGRYSCTCDKPVIWLHTVSVGETRAALTLVRGLRERYPDHQILLTHTTPTGREASEQLYGDDVVRVYLPYDYPFAIRRFLRHFQPRVGVLLETEIWFNLVHACHARSLPLLLLNARLSERSARRYARFPRLARASLHSLHLIAAQTEDDAMRFAALGNHATPVMGNLKFDIAPPPPMLELGKRLREQFGATRPVFLAASTREGEEALLLDALQYMEIENLLVVMVPRHPQRFDEVAALIESRGLHMQRRSANEPVSPHTRVVLGDSMGEMFAYYAACDVAFIGGSLLPFGGQNLIEACAVGKPVLIGPHTYNFSQATELAVACGAAMQISHADDLVHQLNILMHDGTALARMGKAGLQFVSDNRGATEHALTLIGLALSHSLYNEIVSGQVKSAP